MSVQPIPDSSPVAVITGANQGLGLALVAGLRERLQPEATVYLTGRDPDRVAAAANRWREREQQVVPHQLDVRDDRSVERLVATIRDRHGGIDIVFSNAAARISPDEPRTAQVRGFVATNNHGTTRLLRAFTPLLRPEGRYFVVASSFGTLRGLPAPLHPRFDDPSLTLEDLDATMADYVEAVEHGRDGAEGWPEWINVPSKVGQVAAMRMVARRLRDEGRQDVLMAAVCPGLVDTAASRPWFTDMTEAQTPEAAASHLVRLALDAVDLATVHGELIQFGRVLPWR